VRAGNSMQKRASASASALEYSTRLLRGQLDPVRRSGRAGGFNGIIASTSAAEAA
jgi:hypothetical protein